MEATIKFRTFRLPSYRIEELRDDKRPFARVMYAGRLSYESGDDVALREKYTWGLLKMPCEEGYDKRQRKYIPTSALRSPGPPDRFSSNFRNPFPFVTTQDLTA
jgi:hypothetical protein